MARFGAMMAPFVPLLVSPFSPEKFNTSTLLLILIFLQKGLYVKPLPLVLFGILSLFGGITAFLFPETLKKKLPDTVEEAENLGKTDNDIELQSSSFKESWFFKIE